jgi:hypothetical protein
LQAASNARLTSIICSTRQWAGDPFRHGTGEILCMSHLTLVEQALG